MRIPKEAKIEGVAASEPGRYAMHHVMLKKTRDGWGELVATNGRCLVVLEVEVDPEDADGYVTVEAIKAARKPGPHQGVISANGDLTLHTRAGKVSMARPTEAEAGEFPRYGAVIPPADCDAAIEVGINAEYLVDVQRALGAEYVRLRIQPHTVNENGSKSPRAILVTVPKAATKAVGVVMPVTIDD